MDKQTQNFWKQAWEKAWTPFHQEKGHPYLKKFIAESSMEEGREVFVPLSGKAVDLKFLGDQGFRVRGIEISETAIHSFFKENQLSYEKRRFGDAPLYCASSIEILCENFFEVSPEYTKSTQFVFDRASLVALPKDLRTKYYQKMKTLLLSAQDYLLIGRESIPHDLQKGPPYSVPVQEALSGFSFFSNSRILKQKEEGDSDRQKSYVIHFWRDQK